MMSDPFFGAHQLGGGGESWLSGEAFAQVLARCKSGVRMGEAAKKRLKRIVSANVDSMLEHLRKAKKSPKLTGAALAKCGSQWKLVV
jgi:hypothetical protein